MANNVYLYTNHIRCICKRRSITQLLIYIIITIWPPWPALTVLWPLLCRHGTLVPYVNKISLPLALLALYKHIDFCYTRSIAVPGGGGLKNLTGVYSCQKLTWCVHANSVCSSKLRNATKAWRYFKICYVLSLLSFYFQINISPLFAECIICLVIQGQVFPCPLLVFACCFQSSKVWISFCPWLCVREWLQHR